MIPSPHQMCFGCCRVSAEMSVIRNTDPCLTVCSGTRVLNPSQAHTYIFHLSLVVCHGHVGKIVPYLLHHFKTSIFHSLGSLCADKRTHDLWVCECAALPCHSDCFVQVVLGQLICPCSIPIPLI